jgi:hypothetical protein
MQSKRGGRWATGAVVVLGAGGMYQMTGCSRTLPDCYLEDCSGNAPKVQVADCVGRLGEGAVTVLDGPGVFVRKNAAPGGDGTRERPFQSFVEAAATNPRRVYACAEEYDETKSVSFADYVEIYAGFVECDKAWRWSTKERARLNGPPDVIALALHEGYSCIGNLDVSAADAVVAGGSSIAVTAEGEGTVAIVNGKLTAGEARDGSAGSSPSEDEALDGKAGDPGVDACGPGTRHGGPTGITTTCSTGDTSTGGNGGDGGTITSEPSSDAPTPTPGGPGGDGTSSSPSSTAEAGQGKGGAGESSTGTACSDGSNGAGGSAGKAGAGATGAGMISAAGYQGNNGAPGLAGKPGQGGGGGGGARGALGALCPGAGGRADVPGASGGAGGSGGCGGLGGGGGQAGGSSIALMILDATVQLENVDLSAGKAGRGGQGGTGQRGGKAGSGGGRADGIDGALESCRGGNGGDGGRGGPGGGGQGGHSLGIAVRGSTPPAAYEYAIHPYNKGIGGKGGGDNPSDVKTGADGQAERCWDFSANAACSP